MTKIKLKTKIIAAVSASLALAGGIGGAVYSQQADLRIVNYCDVQGNVCQELPVQVPPDLQEMIWCCWFSGGPCVLVSYISDCDPEYEYVMVCDWGRTLIDGTIECFE